MIKISFFLSFFLFGFLFADQNWINENVYKKQSEAQERFIGDKWFREVLLKRMEEDTSYDVSEIRKRTEEILSESKPCGSFEQIEEEVNLYVCLSFSLPDSMWMDYSNQVQQANGVLVVQGIPDNSFLAFAKAVKNLRKKGVTAPIQINPSLFEEAAVKLVPAVVRIQDKRIDKVSGAVTIEYALRLFEER